MARPTVRLADIDARLVTLDGRPNAIRLENKLFGNRGKRSNRSHGPRSTSARPIRFYLSVWVSMSHFSFFHSVHFVSSACHARFSLSVHFFIFLTLSLRRAISALVCSSVCMSLHFISVFHSLFCLFCVPYTFFFIRTEFIRTSEI